MPTGERRYGVWLGAARVGTLNQRGDYTWFAFTEEYLNDPDREVLGLVFEQDTSARHANALRLPPWFSNLLPEGRLREWIAEDRRVSVDREMELLAQVGHDLPGAVRVLAEDEPPDGGWEPAIADADPYGGHSDHDDHPVGWRFSLAGVGLKFSMLREGDRLTLPAYGEGGDWIVKLPDPSYADVPRNEDATMSLAAAAGIDVPEHLLVHRDLLDNLPPGVWPGREEYAYAVRRFDRGEGRRLVHIEDLAQVRNVYPYGGGKYQGTFETVAALIYRRQDLPALREFARRMAFNILVSNGDAHLKNWSLIYRNPRMPTLSPAYDLVSTALYRVRQAPEDLGLRFGGTRRFEKVSLDTFVRLERRLGAGDAGLADCASETAERVRDAWPAIADHLDGYPRLRGGIGHSIANRYETLLKSR
jgi:serine/threonine-protein kinase HipA